jgi:hypothetical protein
MWLNAATPIIVTPDPTTNAFTTDGIIGVGKNEIPASGRAAFVKPPVPTIKERARNRHDKIRKMRASHAQKYGSLPMVPFVEKNKNDK